MNMRPWVMGSATSAADAGTGRRTWLAIMMTLSPSSRTAYVASSIASAGVCTGTTAAGVMRSLNGANISAFMRFTARATARRSSSSGFDT